MAFGLWTRVRTNRLEPAPFLDEQCKCLGCVEHRGQVHALVDRVHRLGVGAEAHGGAVSEQLEGAGIGRGRRGEQTGPDAGRLRAGVPELSDQGRRAIERVSLAREPV